MGAVSRCLRHSLANAEAARMLLRFTQSFSVGAAGAGSPPLRAERHVDADVELVDDQLRKAVISTGSGSFTRDLTVQLLAAGDGLLWSTDGRHFGRFEGAAHLISVRELERRLDDVAIIDATVEQQPGGEISLDVDIEVNDFRRLLGVFADADDAGAELDLRAYSVSMSAGATLAIDWWWSLAGDELDETDVDYRTTVNCGVSVSVVPGGTSSAPAPDVDAGLPVLSSVDAIWDRARAQRDSAGAAG